MKTLTISILAWLAITAACSAQISDPGWYNGLPRDTNSAFLLPGGSDPDVASPPAGITFSQDSLVPNTAEVITSDIQALGNALSNPYDIYNYVHDHIQYSLYFGSKKGAQLTLLEKSGNDFDQCALLVALLRSQGYTANSQFGWMGIPYAATDGTHNDLQHWLRLTLPNTNWNTTSNYLVSLFWGNRGYPIYYFPYGTSNTFEFQRVWVAFTYGGTTYYLDPAFKVSEPVTGINLASAAGISSNALWTAASGTDTYSYTYGLNKQLLGTTLTNCTSNLLSYIQSNCPNASVQQILGGWNITPETDTNFGNLLFPTYSWTSYPAMNITNWAYQPTNLMATFSVSFGTTNFQCYMPQLAGQRLALTFDGSGTAQLWQDDTLLAQQTIGGTNSTTSVTIAVNQPFGNWNPTNNTLIPDTFGDLSIANTYQRTNATYALTYAFEPDWGWLQKRQNKLDMYLQQGLSNTSRQVLTETLNLMGLNWMLQTEQAGHLIEQPLGILPQHHIRLGRMAQEAGHGYYIDVYVQLAGFFPNSGWDAANQDKYSRDFDLFTYFGSALEYGLIEQLQNSGLVGASTTKMLQVANADTLHVIYLATSSSSWGSIIHSLYNYSSTTLTNIGNLISAGYTVLLPENGSYNVAGSGSWAGYGYIAHLNSTNGFSATKCTISGGYNGGYVSDPTTTANTPVVAQTGDAQPQSFTSAPTATPNPQTADPVDTADCTFEVGSVDLSLGGAAPRGISLSRYYNGTRRYNNSGGMAWGWVHNYMGSAKLVAAPQAGLGGTTPAQAAAMLVASSAAISLYNQAAPEPKNWLTTTLIANWGIDQLSKNGVSIALGQDTIQFTIQPTGAYTPPANSTMTLSKDSYGYRLQQRHGSVFIFDGTGRLDGIQDQYGQALGFTYADSATPLPQSVVDWKGRTLSFYYTYGQLTSASDSTGRGVSYGYSTAYNPAGDLTSFTDAEGKTSTYIYDTNHQIIATLDAQSRVVVSNVYDSLGHLTTQYTAGNTNQQWGIYWSGWENWIVDPAGGLQIYHFDDQGRLYRTIDQLGYTNSLVYDGQNHITNSVSALNETNQFIFDGNNNLIQTIDPLGYTNRLVYDANNNLTSSIDQRGNTNTFGYNSQFLLTGTTNGAGDFVTYAYNTDGTLYSRTDAGGTTTYGYDSYGQLNSITYPGGLGSESFVNSALGDVTSHTDPLSFVTSFAYNSRRQLTNTTLPRSRISSIAYDDNGNVASTADQLQNKITNTWSATHHLLNTTFPSTPQGVPVITNRYDNRDLLTNSFDALGHSTKSAYDAKEQLVSLADPLQRTNRFGYDGDGHRLTAVNAANETNSQTWDVRGNPIRSADGAGHFSTRTVDGAGNQIMLTNRNGKVWQFVFDAANRWTNMSSPLSHTTSRTFNHQGLIATITDAANQPTSFHYDAKGRMTNRVDNFGTTTYGYDANDNRTSVVENGLTNSWTFDYANRVHTYTDVYGNSIGYLYDANNNLTNLTYPDGRTVSYAYDSLNRLTNITDWASRKTSLVYDLAGRLTSITRPNGTSRTMYYDAAGEVTNVVEQAANHSPIAYFKLNWSAAARVQWEFAGPLPHTNTPPSRTMTFDDDNRLTTFNGVTVTNDLDGNLTYAPLTNGSFVPYSFDPRNRLTGAGGAGSIPALTHAYDAIGNRIAVSNGANVARFVVNPNAGLPQVLLRIQGGTTNYYVYGPGLLYEVTETTTTTNIATYHYDLRGSTIALADANGVVTDRIEYSTYGLTTFRVGTNDTPFLYNGRYGVQSDLNGLLYMRARFYNPNFCRFINADPSGFAGGLNLYAYANGNPVTFTDPLGLGVWTRVFGGLRALGGGLEAVVGYTFALVTSETVVGAVAGTAVGTHGVDSFQAGLRQMFSGEQTDSMTSHGLQAAGVPRTAANLLDAGVSIVGTAGTSLVGSAPASGQLVHLTDSAGGAGINASGTLIGEGGIYAGPLENAGASGLGVTARTGMVGSSYEAAVPISTAAEGAFSSVTPVGPFSLWQNLTGQAYTQAGTLNLTTGVFTQTGLNWGQATFYGLDAAIMNGTPMVGTALSSSTGK